jgi:hypothetical protein
MIDNLAFLFYSKTDTVRQIYDSDQICVELLVIFKYHV